MITVKRAVTGQMSVALFIVAIAAFALSALDPVVGPLVAVLIGLGVLAAIAVRWQRGGVSHPSIREEVAKDDDRAPIEPK